MEQRPLWVDRPPSREREGLSDERSGASWLDSTRYGGGGGSPPSADAPAVEEPRFFAPLGIWIAAAVTAAVILLVAGLLIGNALSGSDSSSPSADLTISRGRLPVSDVGKVYKAASPAVVSVRVGNGSGTGFLVNSSGTIVTN